MHRPLSGFQILRLPDTQQSLVRLLLSRPYRPSSYVNHMIQPRLARGMPSILFPAARCRLIRHSSTVAINSLLNPKHGTSSNSLSDASITVNGYVRSLRKQKRVAFAAIGDGSTMESLQAVLKPEQAIRYDGPGYERRLCTADVT